MANDGSFAADKLRVAYVSPSLSLSLPWVAKEGGMLAKHDHFFDIRIGGPA